MSTTLRVIGFNEHRMCSYCEVLSTTAESLHVGQWLYVDLTVSGDFGEVLEREFVGRTFVAEYLQPHEVLGINVKEVLEDA